MPHHNCATLEDVRQNIDRIDRQLAALIAEREGYVRQAAAFKRNEDDVKAPQRVKQVIAKVRALAEEAGATPDVMEQTYRAMISAFIQTELAEHARHQTDK